ncbi:MAG: hypothetical protein GDA67_15550 [Nitrospira sp. CR1.3]|nr:hypothetical protein [Nitrospira sp. CR1.3]
MPVIQQTPAAATLHVRAALSERERILVLIEEYRALYGLLAFRLGAVDRRLPVAGGALGAILGGFTAMPPDMQVVVLFAIPVTFIWLLRTTVSHARSKEDVLRRIDEIERQVNQIAGEELISFQSRHPNRHRRVSGRTGMSSVFAVLTLGLSGVVACGYLLGRHPTLPLAARVCYWVYLAAVLVDLLQTARRLRRYRYEKAPTESCPLFIGRRS